VVNARLPWALAGAVSVASEVVFATLGKDEIAELEEVSRRTNT
jgi:hypothetical protein